MRYLALIAISALLTSAPTVPLNAAEPSAEEAAGEKMVCKRRIKTGTRFPAKTCRTAAQWEQIAEANKRGAADMLNKPTIEIRRGN